MKQLTKIIIPLLVIGLMVIGSGKYLSEKNGFKKGDTLETTENSSKSPLPENREILSEKGTITENEDPVPEILSVNVQETDEFYQESKVKASSGTLYQVTGKDAKNKTVAVNPGHGSKAASKVMTFAHPDHSPKLISGSTKAGEIQSPGVTFGTTMLTGEPEAQANLTIALKLKDELLKAGYNVLMIRETPDVDLDNVARTIMANEHADCHISIHFDSTSTDKGAFCITVPEITSYTNMWPVQEQHEKHRRLAQALIKGLTENNVKIHSNGLLPMDLTQISYSKIPTTAVELGDRATDYTSEQRQAEFVAGLVSGINAYFGLGEQ